MPPADTSAPTPTPTPEQPKKQGFFAKLFGGGKKTETSAVPENHESQTPPPQLDDPSIPSAPVAEPVTPAGTDTGLGGTQPQATPPAAGSSDTPSSPLTTPPSVASEAPDTPVQQPSPSSFGAGTMQPVQPQDDSETTPSATPPSGPVPPAQ